MGKVDRDTFDVITLSNAHGVRMRVLTLGATIISLELPDRDGRFGDVVLGYRDLEEYRRNTRYFGALVGRYANRIARGRCRIDGRDVALSVNSHGHHLHGGQRGWDQATWHAEAFERPDRAGVVFTHISPDGDQGYPGAVQATVTYTLGDDDSFSIEHHATTDRTTVINTTQHSYFNLIAGGSSDVLDHELMIDANRFTPVDDHLIPTGELAPVDGTPFDFRRSTRIGARIGDRHPQIERGHGYDHNFVLNGPSGALSLAVRAHDPVSGRALEMFTTEPGVQFYSGNFLDGTAIGKCGRPYGPRAGFCIETQHFPDSPNHPDFPSTLLRPGDTHRSQTVYNFSVVNP
jgi:aldose 1-epimerase